MTLTETYDYLLRVRKMEFAIWKLVLQHEELQSCLLPAAIRYDKDKVQSSPEDKLTDVAAAVLDIESKIRQLHHQKARIILEINAAIDSMPEEYDKEAAIITAYYVKRMTMEEVAYKLGYSLQHTYRLRKRGVSYLSEIL